MAANQYFKAVIKSLARLKNRRRLPRQRRNEMPKLIIAEYQRALSLLVESWKEATEKTLFPKLQIIQQIVSYERSPVVYDSWPEDLAAYTDSLIQEYDILSKQSHELAAGVFNRENGISRTRWYQMAKHVMGVDLIQAEPWIDAEARAFIQNNVTLIKKLSDDTAREIEGIVMNGFRSGKRIETMKKEILGTPLEPGKFSKVEHRARLIARDQTSKLWGDLTRLRQQDVGVEMYIWRTAKDERVRPTHAALEGKYCRWDDATVYADTLQEAMAGNWKKRKSSMILLHPGEDFQCRCYAEAVFEILFAEAIEAQ